MSKKYLNAKRIVTSGVATALAFCSARGPQCWAARIQLDYVSGGAATITLNDILKTKTLITVKHGNADHALNVLLVPPAARGLITASGTAAWAAMSSAGVVNQVGNTNNNGFTIADKVQNTGNKTIVGHPGTVAEFKKYDGYEAWVATSNNNTAAHGNEALVANGQRLIGVIDAREAKFEQTASTVALIKNGKRTTDKVVIAKSAVPIDDTLVTGITCVADGDNTNKDTQAAFVKDNALYIDPEKLTGGIGTYTVTFTNGHTNRQDKFTFTAVRSGISEHSASSDDCMVTLRTNACYDSNPIESTVFASSNTTLSLNLQNKNSTSLDPDADETLIITPESLRGTKFKVTYKANEKSKEEQIKINSRSFVKITKEGEIIIPKPKLGIYTITALDANSSQQTTSSADEDDNKQTGTNQENNTADDTDNASPDTAESTSSTNDDSEDGSEEHGDVKENTEQTQENNSETKSNDQQTSAPTTPSTTTNTNTTTTSTPTTSTPATNTNADTTQSITTSSEAAIAHLRNESEGLQRLINFVDNTDFGNVPIEQIQDAAFVGTNGDLEVVAKNADGTFKCNLKDPGTGKIITKNLTAQEVKNRMRHGLVNKKESIDQKLGVVTDKYFSGTSNSNSQYGTNSGSSNSSDSESKESTSTTTSGSSSSKSTPSSSTSGTVNHYHHNVKTGDSQTILGSIAGMITTGLGLFLMKRKKRD